MIITEKGKYRTLKEFTDRGPISIGTVLADRIIEITQIDKNNHKVIGPQLSDWIYWDLPVEKVDL